MRREKGGRIQGVWSVRGIWMEVKSLAYGKAGVKLHVYLYGAGFEGSAGKFW